MDPIGFTLQAFESSAGPRFALVVTPRHHVRVGAARLEQLRGRAEPPAIDELLRAQARAQVGRAQACVFRGGSEDGGGSWGFDPDLDADSAEELAYLLLRNQVLVYRDLVHCGLCLFVHVEFSELEVDAYKGAVRRYTDECEAMLRDETTAPRERAVAEADGWILRHVVFFFRLEYAALLERVLPDTFSMLERRMDRARLLVEAILSD